MIISVSQLIGAADVGLSNSRFTDSLSVINSYANNDKAMQVGQCSFFIDHIARPHSILHMFGSVRPVGLVGPTAEAPLRMKFTTRSMYVCQQSQGICGQPPGSSRSTFNLVYTISSTRPFVSD